MAWLPDYVFRIHGKNVSNSNHPFWNQDLKGQTVHETATEILTDGQTLTAQRKEVCKKEIMNHFLRSKENYPSEAVLIM